MGNGISNSWNEWISYDPERDPDSQDVRCRCQENRQTFTLATYRCQMVSDSDIISFYPELQRYLHNYHYQNGDQRVYKFIGCAYCLSSPLRDRFTEHKFGWKENSKHLLDYEMIKPKKL